MNYEPRHVYVVSFDAANTDLYYFCSHNDIVLSGVAEANIFRGVLVNPSTTSQSLNPIRANATIGNISFSFLDNNQDLSQLLNTKLTSSPSQGLRAKRVQHWVGEKGAEWSSGYDLLQTQQFYNSIGWENKAYTFHAQDIQRSELEDIFEPKKTTLTGGNITKISTTITVNSAADFELVNHGGAYSDAPNETVGYIKINDEIMRYTSKGATSFTIDKNQTTLNGAISEGATTITLTDASSFRSSGFGYFNTGAGFEFHWTGKSGNQLTGVTGVVQDFADSTVVLDLVGRGALNTQVADHPNDTGQPIDKRTKVEEYIYLEMPAPQMAYAILTGTVYGSSPAATLPSHWNLGIDAAWIATSEFLTIGADLWDTSDDTAGFILRFEGLTKTNAKKFLEEEILFMTGCFTPVLPTGELGLRRMSGVVSDSAYSRILNESNIISISNISYDLDDIHNDFLVDWNYNSINKTYTRSVSLTDTNSINKWGNARQLNIKSKGLKGSRHTDSIIGNLFNIWRDRYAGPPFKASIQLAYSERDIRVGDIVRLQLQNIPEFTDQNNAFSSLDISVEVQKVSINYVTGVVTISVFGSTQRSAPLVIGNPSLNDTFYTSQGSDISGVGTVTGSAGGGVFTITGNSSLVGVTDLNSATATSDNDQGIFYYDGDLTINSGVTLTITNNVELRVKGTFTNNGTINGVGGGLTASTDGQAGYIGETKSDAGFVFGFWGFATVYFHDDVDQAKSSPETNRNKTRSRVATGTVSTVGPFNIINNDTSIAGKPGDLRGTSGGKGGDVYQEPPYTNGTLRATGGAGGAGGAGLILIGRGAVGGVSSSINLSGADGSNGATNSGELDVAAGSGAGGYPGGLVIILDGNTVTETISPYFTANLGACNTIGYTDQVRPLAQIGGYTPNYGAIDSSQQPIHSTEIGYQAESKAISNLYIHYLTEYDTATEDTSSTSSLPTAISVTEQADTQNSINVLGLEMSATAPSDTNYKAARIYIRKQSTQGWQYAGEVASGQECVFWVAADGSTYEIKAHSLSISNVESTDYIERTFTVSNGITTQIGTGSTIISGASVTTNGGLLISGSDLLVYDSSGNVTQSIDLSGTGNFTGIGTTSGSAADEQLVPNNAFNFYQVSTDSPNVNVPDGWYQYIQTTGTVTNNLGVIALDSPNVEGYYINLTDAGTSNGYAIGSKTFKLIPQKKYRVRVRAKHSGTASPIGQLAFYIRINIRYESSGFVEPITSSNRDTVYTLLNGSTDTITDTWATYEYDFTSGSNDAWGNIDIVNWSQTNLDFQVAWVEVLPWGVLSDTNIGVFINDTTFANQGIQLDYNSGTPRAYIGNGAQKYLQFDGTDLSIGEEGGILGVASYPDDTTFYDIPQWISTDGLLTTPISGGTIDLVPSSGTLRCNVTSASGDSASAILISKYSFAGFTWAESRKFKTIPYWASISSTTDIYIITGATSGGFGFKYTGGTWYAWNRWSGSETTTSTSISSTNILEAILDRSTSPYEIRFYVAGSLVATHTTNLVPAGAGTGDEYIIQLYIGQTSADATRHIEIGHTKALIGF